MEDFSRRISVQAQGASNYLVIELQEGEALIPYCCKMIEANNITGLLNMHHQIMDGLICLKYDIGGKMRLRDYMAQHHLTYQNGVLLLRNLSEALLHLGDYFLSTDMCYLEPECLFVGDGLRMYLACVPVKKEFKKDGSARLKAFYEKLLSEYFATADCSSYDEMFKWVYKTTLFDLETFIKKFLNAEQPKIATPLSTPAQDRIVRQPIRQPMQQPIQQPIRQPMQQPMQPQVHVAANPAQDIPAYNNGAPDQQRHELTNLLNSKMPGVQALYFSGQDVAPQKNSAAGNSVAQQQSKGPSFNVPGGPPVAVPGNDGHEQKKNVKANKEKRGFWSFGGKSKNAANGNLPEMPNFAYPTPKTPASKPEPYIPQKPSKHNQPSPISSSDDDWDNGTILVGAENSNTPATNKSKPEHKAYFIHNGERVELNTMPFIIGKSNSELTLQYTIYDNNKVSRSHATFLIENGKYCIRDNQSRNGTFLNGRTLLPLQAVELNDGDEIKLYDEVLIFHKG